MLSLPCLCCSYRRRLYLSCDLSLSPPSVYPPSTRCPSVPLSLWLQGAFDATMPYLFERKQFGSPIGEFQGLQVRHSVAVEPVVLLPRDTFPCRLPLRCPLYSSLRHSDALSL